jgi:hypothetical protein
MLVHISNKISLSLALDMNTVRGNMVTRLWKGLSTGLKTEDIASLHVCQWQSHKKVLLLYLFYRWISAIIFLTIIVCSAIDIGRSLDEKFEDHHTKWWIYLTHWTVLICVVQVIEPNLSVKLFSFQFISSLRSTSGLAFSIDLHKSVNG